MRKRLKKKVHRQYLDIVCVDAVIFNVGMRQQILDAAAGTVISVGPSTNHWTDRRLRRHRLRYRVTVLERAAPDMAVVEWSAVQFPQIRNSGVVFERVASGLPAV